MWARRDLPAESPSLRTFKRVRQFVPPTAGLTAETCNFVRKLVLEEGFEPSNLAVLAPEASAYASSATPA